jgi:L-ascorbate metabolism protein UlaG (beta-lactamase superfamily)
MADPRRTEAVTLRWLGVAGVELRMAEKILLVDPFLTRPPFHRLFIGHAVPNDSLLAARLPRCDYVLVTHPHWDHLMDVPSIALRTSATVVGSPNTCRIAAACGVPAARIKEVGLGDRFSLRPFECEVFPADHGRTPIDWLINGTVPTDIEPPLRLRDYRMDVCFSFAEKAGSLTVLLMPTSGRPADVMMVGAVLPPPRLQELLMQVRPRLVVPVHWDAFFRPITRPLRPMLAPPSLTWPPLRLMHPERFRELVERLAPATRVLLPEPFASYQLDSLLKVLRTWFAAARLTDRRCEISRADGERLDGTAPTSLLAVGQAAVIPPRVPIRPPPTRPAWRAIAMAQSTRMLAMNADRKVHQVNVFPNRFSPIRATTPRTSESSPRPPVRDRNWLLSPSTIQPPTNAAMAPSTRPSAAIPVGS